MPEKPQEPAATELYDAALAALIELRSLMGDAPEDRAAAVDATSRVARRLEHALARYKLQTLEDEPPPLSRWSEVAQAFVPLPRGGR